MPRPLNSDAALVRSVRSGNTDAFEALVHRHQKKAHAIAHALHIPSGARDDVVQESFLQAFRDLRRLRRASRFVPWFLAIVRNSARGFHRRRARTVVTSEVPEVSVSPPDRLEGSELREQVRVRVEQLPDGIREAIFLYYYEGQSTEEVARALGITRSAVKKRLQNGRGVLREKLWRELEESLRDMLPDARTWKQKARTLALVAASCLPIPGTCSAT